MVATQDVKISWNGQVLPIVVVGAPTPSEICSQPPEKLILIGSGNPGICNLYKDFAIAIHTTTGLPIWIMGFVGFDGDVAGKDELEQVVNLEMQVDFKKHIIKKYLKGVQLICVDHSTSCYIFSQLAKDVEISKSIIDGFMLMPVLTVPDGVLWKFANFVLRTKLFGSVVQLLAWINAKITDSTREKLFDNAYRLFWFEEKPEIAPHLNSRMIVSYFHLAKHLFAKPMDMALLTELSQRFQIVCSSNDYLLHSKIREVAEHSTNGSMVKISHQFFADSGSRFGADVGSWIVRNQLTVSSKGK